MRLTRAPVKPAAPPCLQVARQRRVHQYLHYGTCPASMNARRARTGIRAHGRICAAITMLCTLPLVAAYQPRLPGLPALRTSVAASPAHSRTRHAEASRRALGFREPQMKEEEPTSDDSTVLLSAAVVGGLLGLQLTGACASRHRLPDPNPHPAVRWHRRPSPSPADVHSVPTPHSRPGQVISSPRYSFLPSSCSAPPESSQTARRRAQRRAPPPLGAEHRRRRRRRRRQHRPPAG